jgi:hypothetical protein
MLGTFCEQLAGEFPHLNNYPSVIGQIRAAQKLRNKFLHNGFAFNEATNKVEMTVGTARGSLKVQVETIEIADVRRATMAVHEAQLVLYELVFRRKLEPIWTRR